MPADYHTHTALCLHAEGHPADYARRAQALGLDEIGISDHNPMPERIDGWRMDLSEFPRYLELVEEARAAVAPFPVRLGLECDFIAGQEAWIERLADMADWDYLIGSAHYIGEGLAVDDPSKAEQFGASDLEELWRRYWEIFGRAAASGFFDIMGHPDLVKKFGHRPPGDLRRFYEPAVAAVAAAGAAVEINTAGLRMPAAEMYPAKGFLELCREARVPVVISSDSHRPEDVGRDFDRAVALAREVGYDELARFERRARTLHAL